MPTKQEILTNRARNLEHILDTTFGGQKEALAEKIGFKPVTITHFLNPHSKRPCGDKAARQIEAALCMGMYALDYMFQEHTEVYYVAILTNAKYTYETVKALQNEKEIKECSVVLGDFDILLKIEVTSFQFLDLLLAKIVKLPGVKRSKTYHSVHSLRWQREQAANMYLPPKNPQMYFSNGIEEFIHKKIDHFFNEIKELERGDIIVKDSDSVVLENYKLLEGATRSICAIRNPYEDLKGFKRYTEQERAVIVNGVISRRMILLSERYKVEWNRVEENYRQFLKIGSDVRFIFMNQWVKSPLSDNWEQFVIVDDKYVCIRQEEQRQLLIKRDEEMVKMYMNTFEANWSKSLSFYEIEDQLHKMRK